MSNVIKFPEKPKKRDVILWLYQSIGCAEDIQEKMEYFNTVVAKMNPNKIVKLELK